MTALLTRLRTDRTRSQLELVWRLAQRQVTTRYKESALGAAWSVLSPLFLLFVYAVVWGVIFQPRWTSPDGSEGPFALYIFSGIIAFTLFSEIVNSATGLVQWNATLIKRTTVSPKILPISSSLSSLFTFALNSVPFALMYLVLAGPPPWTIVLAPLLVIPLWVLCLGLSFLISAVGAYFRDLAQIVPLLTTAVLFLSPVFYPVDALPERLRPVVTVLSPLGVILPASKDLLFFGVLPDLLPLAAYSVVACAVLALGWWVYGKAARGFADVV